MIVIFTSMPTNLKQGRIAVRHHKVAQIGAALIHSIACILAESQDERVKTLLADIGTIINKKDALKAQEARQLLNRFANYDDSWWMSIMRDRLEAMSDPWLEMVCWRKSGPKSLWKWRGEFPVQIDAWNQELAREHNERFAEFEAEWFRATSKLELDGVLVTWHHFTPWKSVSSSGGDERPQSSLKVYQENGTLKSVSELSPLVRSLLDAWTEDIQVQAFATPDATPENILDPTHRAAFAKRVLASLPVPIAANPTIPGE